MEELKLKISEADLFKEEEVKDLFNDIDKIEDEEERTELIGEVFKKLHEDLLEGVYSSEDKIQETIDRLETLYIENTELNSFQVREYFDDNNIKSNLLAEEILKKVDEEIEQLEEELSEEIKAANNEGITVVEYIEKEIARLENEKSNEVKYYNELIEKVQQEIKDRELFATEEDLINKITKLRNEQEEIYASANGYPSDEDVRRYHEINQLVNNIRKEIDYRNNYRGKSVDELTDELSKLEKEAEELWNADSISGEGLSEKDNERYHELTEMIKYIKIELARIEKTKYDKFSDQELNEQLSKLEKEAEELWNADSISGEGLSEKDNERYHELTKLIGELKEELKKREENKYSKYSDEELKDELSKLEKEAEELWNADSISGEGLSEKDNERYHELTKLIGGLKEELKKREKDPTRALPATKTEDLEKMIKELLRKQKEVQSTYDKRVEELNVKLQKAHRLEELKKFKENFKTKENEKERKKIENIEKAKKIALKALIVVGGFGTGLALSSIPGIGVISMTAATVKLAHAGIKLWTKKFPEGKVAKIVDTTKNKFEEKFGVAKDKFNEKFGDKINNFKEKHPNIVSKIKMAKDKIKEVLKSKNFNLFVNGVSAGYLTGNLVELFTGQTVFEHIGDWFEPEAPELISQSAPLPGPGDGKPSFRPDPIPGDIPSPEITLEPGATYDLSGIAEGFVSSDATQPVNLMTGVADDLTFDRIVNGRAHFIQANGQGMAWYDLDQVQEYLAKAAEVAGKVK